MKNFLHLTLTVCILAAASLGCSWNLGKSDQPQNANVAVANDPEPSGTPDASGAEAQFAAAEPLVADLYKQHAAERGPFRDRKRATVDKYFAKPLADLIWKDQQTPAGEMGALDFDPLYDAQDVEIKKLNVGKATVNGEKATVPVSFENYGTKKTLTYQLVRQGDAWKISDIKYPENFTLLSVFKENTKTDKPSEPASSTSGEFEGRYRVGDTTCTVRPDRMAFEVKWAKGSGSEYFFYKDANVFESEEDKSGGRNEFRFDDENYNTGTFVRADGKTFAVSRAK